MQGRVAVNRSPNSRLIPEQAGPQELRGGERQKPLPPRQAVIPLLSSRGKGRKIKEYRGKTEEREIERAGFLRFKLRLTQEEPPAIDEKEVSPCPPSKIEFHS